jgi:hypothetical protein
MCLLPFVDVPQQAFIDGMIAICDPNAWNCYAPARQRDKAPAADD